MNDSLRIPAQVMEFGTNERYACTASMTQDAYLAYTENGQEAPAYTSW